MTVREPQAALEGEERMSAASKCTYDGREMGERESAGRPDTSSVQSCWSNW